MLSLPFKYHWATVALVLCGCGSRSTLLTGEQSTDPQESPSDANDSPNVPWDVLDPPEAPTPSPSPSTACSSDLDCDDGISCTTGTCNSVRGVCEQIPVDALCDDGSFCSGPETCDLELGCVSDPVDCSDGNDCTTDICDDDLGLCLHDPAPECRLWAYASSPTMLYEVELPSGQAVALASTSEALKDIALHPDGTLYGLTGLALVKVDVTTGQLTTVRPFEGQFFNGMDLTPGGELYLTGGSAFYHFDLDTGTLNELASFPEGLRSSGDIAIMGNRYYATASGWDTDQLVQFDLDQGSSKIVGDCGIVGIWGLAAFGQDLYGFTYQGEVVTVDTTTGAVSTLSEVNDAFFGASAR